MHLFETNIASFLLTVVNYTDLLSAAIFRSLKYSPSLQSFSVTQLIAWARINTAVITIKAQVLFEAQQTIIMN